jgi:hypothetical protein
MRPARRHASRLGHFDCAATWAESAGVHRRAHRFEVRLTCQRMIEGFELPRDIEKSRGGGGHGGGRGHRHGFSRRRSGHTAAPVEPAAVRLGTPSPRLRADLRRSRALRPRVWHLGLDARGACGAKSRRALRREFKQGRFADTRLATHNEHLVVSRTGSRYEAFQGCAFFASTTQTWCRVVPEHVQPPLLTVDADDTD